MIQQFTSLKCNHLLTRSKDACNIAHAHPNRTALSHCAVAERDVIVALAVSNLTPRTPTLKPPKNLPPPTSHLKHQPHITSHPTPNQQESESFPSFAPLAITHHLSSSLVHLRHPGALLSLRRGPRHGQLCIHSALVVQCPQVAAHQLCAPCIIPVIIRAQSRPSSCSAVAFRSISLCLPPRRMRRHCTSRRRFPPRNIVTFSQVQVASLLRIASHRAAVIRALFYSLAPSSFSSRRRGCCEQMFLHHAQLQGSSGEVRP